MATFEKLANGNVKFNDDNCEYAFPGAAILQKHPDNVDLIIFNIPYFTRFEINWNDVTSPVVASRDDLFDQLSSDIFY